ncbi:MAG: hypothetical protein KF718_19840 [Polyangiaceae bacterium]|nr:hypothetical protein [Polyangiaceae bacterium]
MRWSDLGACVFLLVGCGGDDFSSAGTGGSSTGGSGASDASAGSGGTPGGSGGAFGGNGGSPGGAGGATAGAGGATGGSGGATGGSGGGSGGSGGGSGGSGGATGGSGGGSGGSGGSGGGSGGAVSTGGTGGVSTAWADCGLPIATLPTLYTKLGSSAEVTSPSNGNGTDSAHHPSPTFQEGKCGHAMLFTPASAFVRYKLPSNLIIAQGSLDFWIRPNFNPGDNLERNLFATASSAEGNLRLVKTSGNLGNALEVTLIEQNGTPHATRVSPPHLQQDTWTRVTIAWKFDTPGPNVSVWLNTAAVPPGGYSLRPAGAKDPGTANLVNGVFFIGAASQADQSSANAWLDDFKIYGFVLNPQ